jgi:hypothetical protein
MIRIVFFLGMYAALMVVWCGFMLFLLWAVLR